MLNASSVIVAAGRPGSRDRDSRDSRRANGARRDRRVIARSRGGIAVASSSAATNASAGGRSTTTGLLTERARAVVSSGPVDASCQARMTMAVRTTATTVRIPPPHDRPGAVARTVVMTATRITRNAAASEPGARVAPVTIAMGSAPAQPARNATTSAPPNHPMTPPMTAGIPASRTRNATRSRRRAPTAMSRATSAATSSRTTSARKTAKASRIATPSEPMRSKRADEASASASAPLICVRGLSTL